LLITLSTVFLALYSCDETLNYVQASRSDDATAL